MPKILLVEDNELNRVMLTRRLQRLHYSVVVAHDATQGRALASSERPDLILMDIGLPGRMDGLQLTQVLKSDPAMKQIPIIVLTAQGMEVRDKAFAAGCEAFALKPVAFSKLQEMIENLMLQHKN
jgi:CheY-like chemotaxis protein